ncbi:hypothetical protein JTB14_011053 [Gonioctena quinquepunctata]|nr:hypothetical protein JTB14_011053 [Gonioctena quinquepunctata]
MNDKTETTTSKVERLIEVNRIIKVETKEEHDKNHIIEMNSEEVSPIQNKVGEVNRVTVIKVVDTDDHMKNKNEGMIPISPVYIQKNTTSTESAIKSSVDMIIQIAKVQEIPATDILERVNLTNISVSLNTSGIPLPPQREGRKFEIFGVGGSKIADNKNVNQFIGKADIIYGISNINVVTPRSAHNTESSTISLEGLFRTEGSTLFSKTPTINDELLETDHSKFVNVRVLHPDESMRVNKEHTKSGKVIPIKILKQDDDEYAMKADVIEVPAKPNLETIKIAPIKVEMSKSIASNLPLIRFSSKSLPTV